MLKEILYKIERLEDFVSNCQNNGELSLLDKDVILQSLRDIYMESSSLTIAEDDFFENNEDDSTNTIVFDQDDTFVISETEQVVEVEATETTEAAIESTPEVEAEPEIILLSLEEEEEDEEEEEVVATTILEQKISDSNKATIIEQLCDNDSDKYQQIIQKLDEIEDFDSAMLYLHDKFEDKLNNDAVALLADILSYKITE